MTRLGGCAGLGPPDQLAGTKGSNMFRRILTTVVTAAALTSAAPVLASESRKDVQQLPPCCERVAMQLRDHDARLESAEKKATPEQGEQKAAPRVEEDRRQPWGFDSRELRG